MEASLDSRWGLQNVRLAREFGGTLPLNHRLPLTTGFGVADVHMVLLPRAEVSSVLGRWASAGPCTYCASPTTRAVAP